MVSALQTNRPSGGAGGDTLIGGEGNDILVGGNGNDTAIFSASRANTTLSYVGGQVVVTTAEGSATLLGVETIRLSDVTITGNDENPLVNDLFYYARNSDVWRAGLDPDVHFADFGWREGRDPSATFDNELYLARNPNVAQAAALCARSSATRRGSPSPRCPTRCPNGSSSRARRARPSAAGGLHSCTATPRSAACSKASALPLLQIAMTRASVRR